MKNISTPNALLLHLYNDNSAGTQAIPAEHEISGQLLEEFNELSAVKEELDRLKCSPSPTSIRIILNHSMKTGHLQEI